MSTPVTPFKLEFHFDFEPSKTKLRYYWLHFLKMAKYSVIPGAFVLVVLLFYVQEVRTAPSILVSEDSLYKDRTATRRLIMNQLKDIKEEAAIPSPPAGEETENQVMNPSIDISPQKLQFIKSSKCKLHNEEMSGLKKPTVCGYRQIDVHQGVSGVLLWRPAACHPYHCRCAPTQEVKRMRKTIANNKTTVEYHRYRVFECV